MSPNIPKTTFFQQCAFKWKFRSKIIVSGVGHWFKGFPKQLWKSLKTHLFRFLFLVQQNWPHSLWVCPKSGACISVVVRYSSGLNCFILTCRAGPFISCYALLVLIIVKFRMGMYSCLLLRHFISDWKWHLQSYSIFLYLYR